MFVRKMLIEAQEDEEGRVDKKTDTRAKLSQDQQLTSYPRTTVY